MLTKAGRYMHQSNAYKAHTSTLTHTWAPYTQLLYQGPEPTPRSVGYTCHSWCLLPALVKSAQQQLEDGKLYAKQLVDLAEHYTWLVSDGAWEKQLTEMGFGKLLNRPSPSPRPGPSPGPGVSPG